jgi:four helix bundle protein
MDLAKAIYPVTRAFPKEETYGLTSQTRRYAVSVPSNIAEGYGRLSRGEPVQFLDQARGSLFELETQILLCRDFRYFNEIEAEHLLKDVGQVARMLSGLLKSTWLSSGSPLSN